MTHWNCASHMCLFGDMLAVSNVVSQASYAFVCFITSKHADGVASHDSIVGGAVRTHQSFKLSMTAKVKSTCSAKSSH